MRSCPAAAIELRGTNVLTRSPTDLRLRECELNEPPIQELDASKRRKGFGLHVIHGTAVAQLRAN